MPIMIFLSTYFEKFKIFETLSNSVTAEILVEKLIIKNE